MRGSNPFSVVSTAVDVQLPRRRCSWSTNFQPLFNRGSTEARKFWRYLLSQKEVFVHVFPLFKKLPVLFCGGPLSCMPFLVRLSLISFLELISYLKLNENWTAQQTLPFYLRHYGP